VILVWFLSLAWSVGYCYLFGYQHSADSWIVQWGWASPHAADSFAHFLGIPNWIWIGILVPWLLCTVFTFVFAVYGIADDDLGGSPGEGAGHGH
jgi:hypothetical protein